MTLEINPSNAISEHQGTCFREAKGRVPISVGRVFCFDQRCRMQVQSARRLFGGSSETGT